MVSCAKCGKIIGLFKTKYDYENENGNPIKYCSECHKNYIMKQLILQKIEVVN